MAGSRSGPRARAASWKAPSAGVATAAVILAATLIALAMGWLPRGFAVPLPPLWFWIALALVLSASATVYAGLGVRTQPPAPRSTPRTIPSTIPHTIPRTVPRTIPRPTARPTVARPPAPKEEDIDTFLAKLGGGPAAPVLLSAAAEADRRDREVSKLTEWLDGVSAQVCEWAAIAASLEEPTAPAALEPDATGGPDSWNPVLVPSLDDAEPRERKSGAWTETRARTAIERYLHLKPWAPPTHVAEALDMDLRLATRVVEALRREEED
jgi:hypothetical protein